MIEFIKRKLLHAVVKWVWSGRVDYGILLTDKDRQRLKEEAKHFKNSMLFEKLNQVLLEDAVFSLSRASSKSDMVLPKAQIYITQTLFAEMDKMADYRTKVKIKKK